MIKLDIINEVVNRTGITKTKAEIAVETVFLLSMSGVYHMMESGGTARAVMGRLDHSAIFVLIAGTFTPVHGILFRGWARWGPCRATRASATSVWPRPR